MARGKLTTDKDPLVEESLDEVFQEEVQEAAAETPPAEKMVEVYFPPVKEKGEQNFVQVGVNGKMYQIMKGERVMVPAAVAEVIRNSEREANAFAKRMLEGE